MCPTICTNKNMTIYQVRNYTYTYIIYVQVYIMQFNIWISHTYNIWAHMCLSSISSTLSPYSQLHFKDPRWDPRIVWSYYDGTKSQHKLRPWWTSPSPYLCPVRCQGVLFPWHEPHNRTYYFRVNWDKTHRFGRTCSIHDRLPTLPYCYMLMYVNILWYISP